MQNQTSSNRLPLYLLIFVIVLLSIVIGYLLFKTSNLDSSLRSAAKELKQQKEAENAQNLRLFGEIDHQKLLQRPVVLAQEQQVVFPELNVTLPFNNVTKFLQYTYDGENMRVTSSVVSDHKERQQLGCTELVRINMKDGSPFSPWDEAAGSVKLSDGRTLYIIAAKAFKNNEASTEECASEVWKEITPQQVAEEFKKAQTY